MNKCIFQPIKETVVFLFAIFIALPVATIVTLLGFQQCWGCTRTFHRFTMKKYDVFKKWRNNEEALGTRAPKPVIVCEQCYQELQRKEE